MLEGILMYKQTLGLFMNGLFTFGKSTFHPHMCIQFVMLNQKHFPSLKFPTLQHGTKCDVVLHPYRSTVRCRPCLVGLYICNENYSSTSKINGNTCDNVLLSYWG